jgi:hypothetical protein
MFITTLIILGGPNENDLFTIEEINIIIDIRSTQTLIFEVNIYFGVFGFWSLFQLIIFFCIQQLSSHFFNKTIKLYHIDFLFKLSIKECCENIEMKKYSSFLVISVKIDLIDAHFMIGANASS